MTKLQRPDIRGELTKLQDSLLDVPKKEEEESPTSLSIDIPALGTRKKEKGDPETTNVLFPLDKERHIKLKTFCAQKEIPLRSLMRKLVADWIDTNIK